MSSLSASRVGPNKWDNETHRYLSQTPTWLEDPPWCFKPTGPICDSFHMRVKLNHRVSGTWFSHDVSVRDVSRGPRRPRPTGACNTAHRVSSQGHEILRVRPPRHRMGLSPHGHRHTLLADHTLSPSAARAAALLYPLQEGSLYLIRTRRLNQCG